MQLGKRTDRSVEHKIFGAFVQQLVDTELLATALAERGLCVNFPLHHVKLAIDRRQAALRFDQNQAVHTVCDVMRHHRRCAMIYV